MSIILAIEPDRRQAAHLTAIVRHRVGAELILADTTEGALDAIGNRIPDMVLVPAFLSPRDDASLAAALRVIATAAHVRTLTIPVLSSGEKRAARGGILARWRRARAESPAPDGCDPAVFAEQITAYLKEAAAEYAEPEVGETVAIAPIVEAPSARLAGPVMEVPPVELITPVMDAPPVELTTLVMDAPPVELITPVMDALPVELTTLVMDAPPVELTTLVMEAPPVELATPVVDAPPVELITPVMEAPPVELATPMMDVPPVEPAAPVQEAPPVELATPVVDAVEPVALTRAAAPASADDDKGAVDLSAELTFLSKGEDDAYEAAGDTRFAGERVGVDAPDTTVAEPAAVAEEVTEEAVVEESAVEEAARPRGDLAPWTEMYLTPGRIWPTLEGVQAETLPPDDECMAKPEAVAARPRPLEWTELVASLRQDIERRRAERVTAADPPVAASAANVATIGGNKPDTRQKRRGKKVKPAQDEWGFFDPEQCGFAALLAKLDEITVSSDPADDDVRRQA